jgi:hypothetical protein
MQILIRVVGFSLVFAAMVTSAALDENAKYWVDEGTRAAFLKELASHKVPFRVDAEGRIWYPSSYVTTVDGISKAVLGKTTFDGYRFDDPQEHAEFLKRLNKESIPFKERLYLGKRWITWDKKYDERVYAIRDAIEDETTKRLKAGNGKEHR